MKRVTRRQVLIAAGVTASAAGCLGRRGEDVASGSPGELPALVDAERRFPATTTGDLVDGFEDLSRWMPSIGNLRADGDEWVLGSQSLRLDSTEDGEAVGAIRRLDPPLDLDEHHLSMAVKVETNGPARVTTSLYAPDRRNHLRARRYVVRALDGWHRIDLGYTGRRGDPDLSSVQEIHLGATSLDGEPIRLRVDDLRATPRADAPTAVLVFDNAFESHYSTVFPLLEDRGIVGVVPVGVDVIGSPGRLDISQLRGLRDAGWDVASRPFVSEPLPQRSPENQRAAIQSNRTHLVERGFPDGAAHFFPHGYGMDATTVDIVRELHESAVTFGASPNASPPSSRFVASRFDGDAGDSTRRVAALAAEYDQSVILGFSRIDDSMDDFVALLDVLNEQAFQITSLTDLFAA